MRARAHAVLLSLLGALVPGLAEAALPSKADVRCVTALDAGAARVLRAQQKLDRGCLAGVSGGKQSDAGACIAADARGLVVKAAARLLAAHDRKCAVPPRFAFTAPAVASAAAAEQGEGLLRDLLDDGGAIAVIALADDPADARCQQKVTRAADTLLRVGAARFVACVRKSLAGLESAAVLRDVCLGALAAERAAAGGKLAKVAAKIASVRADRCRSTALADAFPGVCASLDGDAFDACVEERAACRTCRMLDAVAELDADCDTFDDGTADASCAPPTSPPSSTSSSTSTSTSTSTAGSVTSTSTETSSTSSTTTTSSATVTSTSSSTSTSGTVATSSTSTSVPPPAPFAIAIGDTVSDGVPAAGAGNVETPGALDVYVFSAAPGDTIFFDEGDFSGDADVPYRITDEDGTVVADDAIGGFEPGVLGLVRGGTYTITVGSPLAPGTGTYGFTLWSVPPPELFPIVLDQEVSDGVPAAGAGSIETPGRRDVYTFAAAAGTVVYVDEQDVSAGLFGLAYALVAPSDATVVANALGGFEPGRLTLPETGTYTLVVGSDGNDAVGTYAFTIRTVPPDDAFAIGLDQVVSDGVPAAGAGNVEAPGARDVYTFAATAGTLVFVDELANSALGIAYRLVAPSGATVFFTTLGGFEPGRLTLSETGTYTVVVGNDTADVVGTYALVVRTVPPDDVFAVAIGDAVSDGVPGPGAGNLETPGARDEYTFSAVAGTGVVIDEQSVSADLNGMAYQLLRPGGATLLSNALGGFEPGPVTLPDTGTYMLRVGADTNDGTGTYGLAILAAP